MTLVSEMLAEALGERYALDREIGRGAMATVYLARDVGSQQPVAVKIMHGAVANALGTERFLREIEIARSLSHPNIVPVSDSGSAGELLYYIMPYLEGESLFDRLERERQLPIEDALRITRDVAGALGYAHGRGVLHRDVKPENVLLAGGRALVADFGLARAIGAADYQKLTATGIMVGTVYYMSPEQIIGRRDLDQRADIYGLGCVLYEMLTGEPPYAGRVLNQVVTMVIRAPVPSAQMLCPTVPAAVDQAITRALAKSASERFATMEEFVAALGISPA